MPAQPSLTYTTIEREVPYNHTDGAFSYDHGKAQAKSTPAHELSETQQREHRTNRAREALKEVQTRLEQKIEDLIQRRSLLLNEEHDREGRELLQEEYDNLIRVHENRLAKLDFQVANVANQDYAIPRDERKVAFEDLQTPDRLIDFDNKPQDRARTDREMVDKLTDKVERLEKLLKMDAPKPPKPSLDLSRPTYIKVHRKHMDPETLDEYELPWEWMTVSPLHHLASDAADTSFQNDPDYILIKRWIPEHDQEILFEHTKKLREGRFDKEGVIVHYKEERKSEKPKRDASFQAEVTRPDDGKSQALILRKPNARYSSREYPSRISTYQRIRDDGIRVWAKDVSPPPSPISRPPQPSKSLTMGPESLEGSARSRSRAPNLSFVRRAGRSQSPISAEFDADVGINHLDGESLHEMADNEADLIAETLLRYTTYSPDDHIPADAKTSPSSPADAPEQPPSPETHGDEDNVSQNGRADLNGQDDDDLTNHDTRHADRSPSPSPSPSESGRQLIRKTDTELYEADSEGSGKEARRLTFERQGTWRRPTVEDDEIVVEEEED